MQQAKIPLKWHHHLIPKPTISLQKTTLPVIHAARKRKLRYGSQRTAKSILKTTAFIITALKILPQPLDIALEAAIGGNNNGGSGFFRGGFNEWWDGGRRRRRKKMGGFKVVLLFGFFVVCVCCCLVLEFKDRDAALFGVELKKLVLKLRNCSPVVEFVKKSKKVVKALR